MSKNDEAEAAMVALSVGAIADDAECPPGDVVDAVLKALVRFCCTTGLWRLHNAEWFARKAARAWGMKL